MGPKRARPSGSKAQRSGGRRRTETMKIKAINPDAAQPGELEDPARLARTVFVGNVSAAVNRKELKQLFRPYGEVETVRLRGVIAANPKLPKKTALLARRMHKSCDTVLAYVVFKPLKSTAVQVGAGQTKEGGTRQDDGSFAAADVSNNANIMLEKDYDVVEGSGGISLSRDSVDDDVEKNQDGGKKPNVTSQDDMVEGSDANRIDKDDELGTSAGVATAEAAAAAVARLDKLDKYCGEGKSQLANDDHAIAVASGALPRRAMEAIPDGRVLAACAALNLTIFREKHLRVNPAVHTRGALRQSVFLGNLPFDVTEEELIMLFSPLAEQAGCRLAGVRVTRDRKTGMGRGVGFASFDDELGVRAVLNQRGYVKLRDRVLRMERAAKEKKRNSKTAKRLAKEEARRAQKKVDPSYVAVVDRRDRRKKKERTGEIGVTRKIRKQRSAKKHAGKVKHAARKMRRAEEVAALK